MATSRSGSVLFNARTEHGKIREGDRNYVKPFRIGKTKRDRKSGARKRLSDHKRARARTNSDRAKRR